MPVVTATFEKSGRYALPIYERKTHTRGFIDYRDQSAWPLVVDGKRFGYLYRNRFGHQTWTLLTHLETFRGPSGATYRTWFLPPAYEAAQTKRLAIAFVRWMSLSRSERPAGPPPIAVFRCLECHQRLVIDVRPQGRNYATFCWNCGSSAQKFEREF